jgi:hypothetical protein
MVLSLDGCQRSVLALREEMSRSAWIGNGWSFYLLVAVLAGFFAPFQLFGESDERLILSEDFEDGLDLWRVEDRGGHHLVEVTDGRLIIRNLVPTPGVFVWSRVELPTSFRLEFDFCPLGRGKSQEGFYLLFFGALALDGTSIFEEEVWHSEPLEDFRKYTRGDIRCYHIGYLRGKTGLCNLRKNPGLNLVQSNEVPGLVEGETYRIVVEKRGGSIKMSVSGLGIEPHQRIFQDWEDLAADSPVLDGGAFAFRQIAYDEGVAGAYDNVRLVALVP